MVNEATHPVPSAIATLPVQLPEAPPMVTGLVAPAATVLINVAAPVLAAIVKSV